MSVVRVFRGGMAGSAVAVLAACGGRGDVTQPPPVSAEVSLGATEYALLAGSQVSGRVRFPAAAAAGAQYLVVGQFATGTSGVSAGFTMGSAEFSEQPALLADRVFQPADPRARFHDALRRWDSELVRAGRASGVRAAAAPPAPAPPPTVGSQRTFKVCASLDATGCATFDNVPATASYVGVHAAIFVDDSAPANGLSSSDIAQLGQQFDDVLYPIDSAAFGAESDVDANGVVIVLLTKTVNGLVPKPECDESFIVGFFLGADIFPSTRTLYNNGEVIYGFLPELSPPSTRCARSVATVKALLPSTFIHEFQHMISFNQHALIRNGDTEVLWLNEALSHLAEELGGLHYDSLNNTSAADQFLVGNLYDAFLYLKDPSANAVVTESSTGTLEERGGAWLFIRYVADRFGAPVLRRLVQTTNTGEANVVAVTRTPLATLLGRWALAVYATDLPGFTPPQALTYDFWRFRARYAALNASPRYGSFFDRPYPLVPSAPTGTAFSVGGTMKSGSGAYVLVTQAADGAGFDITFRASNGNALPANAGAQLAVLRIR
ncbi:MAG: hypothetical protein Q8Q85_02760 [Gemmatimonadales bacterium]|nr:hypothetical protein [Gemmatimonadales bacterium]